MITSQMKEKVYSVVQSVASSMNASHEDRHEVCRIASLKLDKIGINVAVDGSKAGDYLCDALDEYLY